MVDFCEEMITLNRLVASFQWQEDASLVDASRKTVVLPYTYILHFEYYSLPTCMAGDQNPDCVVR